MKKIRWIQSKLTRRLFATVGWIGAVAVLLMAMGFAGKVEKSTICESVVVDIDVSDNRYFVGRQDVLNMFRSEGV
jgi:hypothetical protein